MQKDQEFKVTLGYILCARPTGYTMNNNDDDDDDR